MHQFHGMSVFDELATSGGTESDLVERALPRTDASDQTDTEMAKDGRGRDAALQRSRQSDRKLNQQSNVSFLIRRKRFYGTSNSLRPSPVPSHVHQRQQPQQKSDASESYVSTAACAPGKLARGPASRQTSAHKHGLKATARRANICKKERPRKYKRAAAT